MTQEEVEAVRKKARDQLRFITDLRDRAKDAAESFPALQQTYELAIYYSKVLDTIPDTVPEGPKIILLDSLTASHQFYDANRSHIEAFDPEIVASGLAFYASGSVPTYESLSALTTASNEEIRNWASPIIKEYRELQIHQNKSDSISSLLQSIKPDLEAEFQDAIHTFQKSLGGLVGKQAAGIALRNVLEHLKGEIHSRAVTIAQSANPATQKLKWIEMAPILAKGGSQSAECNQFIFEETNFHSLKGRLTLIAKNRSQIANDDLEDLFVELLDHLYAVLNLIDPKLL